MEEENVVDKPVINEKEATTSISEIEKSKDNDDQQFSDAVFKSSYMSCLNSEYALMPPLLDQIKTGVRCIQFDLWCEEFESLKDFILGGDEPGESANNRRIGNPRSLKFSNWLAVVSEWCSKNPVHPPITIFLNLRQDISRNQPMQGSITNLNMICQKIFKDKILSPIHLIDNKWPTVKQMLGKVLFVLSGNPATKRFYLHDKGYNPAICLSSNTVIEVHNTKSGYLFYWTGELQENGLVKWKWHAEYDRGETPSIAVRADGVIVEVHKSERTSGLWYNIGKLSPLGYIVWTKPTNNSDRKFASGSNPSVKFNSDGYVQVFYRDDSLFGLVGEVDISAGKIKWKENTKEKKDKEVPSNNKATEMQNSITITTENTFYSESTLFYQTNQMQKPQRLCYYPFFFSEWTEDSDLPADDPEILFLSTQDNCEDVIVDKAKGKLVRVCNFGEFSEVPKQLTVNFPSTCYTDELWYSEYLDGKNVFE